MVCDVDKFLSSKVAHKCNICCRLVQVSSALLNNTRESAVLLLDELRLRQVVEPTGLLTTGVDVVGAGKFKFKLSV